MHGPHDHAFAPSAKTKHLLPLFSHQHPVLYLFIRSSLSDLCLRPDTPVTGAREQWAASVKQMLDAAV